MLVCVRVEGFRDGILGLRVLVCNIYMVVLIDTGNDVILYIENDATHKGDNMTTPEKIEVFKVQSTPLNEAENKDYWFNTLKIKLNRNDLIEILIYKGVADFQSYFNWWSWSELVNGTNKVLGINRFNKEAIY